MTRKAKCPHCGKALTKRWRTRVGYFGKGPSVTPITICAPCGIVVQIRRIPFSRPPSPPKRIKVFADKKVAQRSANAEADRRRADWFRRHP